MNKKAGTLVVGLVFFSLLNSSLKAQKNSAVDEKLSAGSSAFIESYKAGRRLHESHNNENTVYTQSEKQAGWHIDPGDGKLEFLIQFQSVPAVDSSPGDQPVLFTRVPQFLKGRIERVIVRIGDEPLPRADMATLFSRPLVSSSNMASRLSRSTSKDFGWIVNGSDGGVDFIIQSGAEKLSYMAAHKKELANDVPPWLSHQLDFIALTVGNVDLPTPGPTALSANNSSGTRSLETSEVQDSSAILKLKQTFEELEEQANTMAATLKRSPSVSDAQRTQLQVAVRQAFEARQSWQRAESAELLRRAAELQQSTDHRERHSDKIIERRVDDLLDTNLKW